MRIYVKKNMKMTTRTNI